MRFDPTGARVAYTLGYGEPAATRRLRILIASRDGIASAVFIPGGHEPRWFDASTLYARSLDGGQSDADAGPYRLHLLGANDGDLSAAGDTLAYAPSRTSGVRVMGPVTVAHYPDAYEPSLSSGGTLALRSSTTGILRLERLPACVDLAAGDPILGPGTRARWSSQTVVWDAIPFGRVYGRSTPNAPTVELTIPGRACSRPVPLWTGARLYVALVLDDGDLVVCDWASLVARDGMGWRVGRSDGSAFDWDLANSLDGPRVAWLTPAGALATKLVETFNPPVRLGTAAPPPVDPPPVPEVPPMSEVLPAAVKASRDRYVAKFPIPQGVPGDAVEEACRQWSRALSQQVIFDTGDHRWGMKNAGGGRPTSKDTIALLLADGESIQIWDLISGAGTGHGTLVQDPRSELVPSPPQLFEPQPAVDHVGAGPVDPPPVDPPPVDPPPSGDVLARLTAIAGQLAAIERRLDQPFKLEARF